MVRDAVAFPMLAVLSLMIEGPRPIAKSHIPLLVVLGLLGIAIGQLCYIYGVFLTSPNVASIFQVHFFFFFFIFCSHFFFLIFIILCLAIEANYHIIS